MIVKQLWIGNNLRNFNYLLVCPESGETAAIDPLDHLRCLQTAKENGWDITKVINTHEHQDHIAGNKKVIDSTGATLFAPDGAKNSIRNVDVGLKAGDTIKIGTSVELEVLNTPGHTMSHISMLSHTDQPALICGDTLFNAGAGNCINGGHPEELFKTFVEQLYKLPDNTQVFPGHEYIISNLEFTLDREPHNEEAHDLLKKLQGQDLNNAKITTLGLEKKINTFFRLQNPELLEKLKTEFPELGKSPNLKEVFIKLRELRNTW